VVGQACPDVHCKLRPNRFPSNFVKFSNLAKFEVPVSVWSNFFVVRTNFFAVQATFLLSVYCRNNSVNLSNRAI
jgi:hypothetical protein